MIKLLTSLLQPFKNKPLLFLFIAILIVFVEIYFALLYSQFSYFVQISLFGATIAYGILYIYHIINSHILKLIYIYSITCIITIMQILSYFVKDILQQNFNAELTAIFSETNPTETYEFITTYFSCNHFAIIVIVFFIVLISLKLILRHDNIVPPRLVIYSCLLLPILGTITYIRNPWYIANTFIGQIYSCRYAFSHTPNLIPSLTPNDITYTGNQPQTIILIIGESYVKSHSSLYGYQFTTTPLQKSFLDRGDLIVFSDAVAPATHTIQAIKHIMTVNCNNNFDENWNKLASIPEIANIAGYNTFWISNQNEKGLYDNTASKFAEICNKQFFTDNTFKAWNNKNLDETIFPYLTQLGNSRDSLNFLIIHLMGQHIAFDTRYPIEFDYFKPEQYHNLPENQQKIVATYDNATRYNDFIVAEIFSKFADREAIIISTSDHAIDLFHTDSTYYGNARPNNPLSAKISKEIPFVIYTSKKYREKFPHKLSKLDSISQQPFNTDDLPYLMCEIMNIKIKQ